MSLLNQKTINKKITISGIGLHSGKNVNLKILPSKENTGIVFLRSDLGKDNVVIPHFNNVSDTTCLLYTSPSPRDRQKCRMPSSA